MSRATGVKVMNKKSGHLGTCAAGCGCGGVNEAGARRTQVAPKTDLPTAVRSFKDNAAKVVEIAHGIAATLGLRVVEVPDEPVGNQFAEPTSPWERAPESPARPERRFSNEPRREPQRLDEVVPQRFDEPGTRTVLPERAFNPTEPVTHYAEPTSPWGGNVADKFPEDTKNPIGDSDDPKVLRRRRATELERQIMDAKKRLASVGAAGRARIDLELQEWSTELEAIREAERKERDEYKRF